MGLGHDFVNWLSNNKSSIFYYGGKALEASGIPIASGLGVAATALGEIMQEGEAKEAMQKELEQQRMRQYGNRNVAYSDMPRIHYSKKPYSYISHHHPYFNRRETFDDVLKKYVADRKKREKEEKRKQMQQKQKENEQAQKDKGERQNQNKKDREIRQEQKRLADENRQEKKRINFERQTQILDKKLQLQKTRADNIKAQQQNKKEREEKKLQKQQEEKRKKQEQFKKDWAEACRRRREAYDYFERDDW